MSIAIDIQVRKITKFFVAGSVLYMFNAQQPPWMPPMNAVAHIHVGQESLNVSLGTEPSSVEENWLKYI